MKTQYFLHDFKITRSEVFRRAKLLNIEAGIYSYNPRIVFFTFEDYKKIESFNVFVILDDEKEKKPRGRPEERTFKICKVCGKSELDAEFLDTVPSYCKKHYYEKKARRAKYKPLKKTKDAIVSGFDEYFENKG